MGLLAAIAALGLAAAVVGLGLRAPVPDGPVARLRRAASGWHAAAWMAAPLAATLLIGILLGSGARAAAGVTLSLLVTLVLVLGLAAAWSRARARLLP